MRNIAALFFYSFLIIYGLETKMSKLRSESRILRHDLQMKRHMHFKSDGAYETPNTLKVKDHGH